MSYPIGSAPYHKAAAHAQVQPKFKAPTAQAQGPVQFGSTSQTDPPQPGSETDKPQTGIIGFLKKMGMFFSVAYGLYVAAKALWNSVFGHGKKEESPQAEPAQA